MSLTGKEPTFSATVLPAMSRLVQNRDAPFILVVDDVHLLQSAPAQHVLETLCESCPTDSTIVLLTRSQAPDWLARVRATGRLVEVSSADLAFDLDEAALLLSAMGVRADASDTTAIVEHTEGWAVGVYLTALVLRSGDRAPADGARIVKGSDRIVADYVRTQVLATLSADQRRFLTLSSVLDELDGPLCDAVLERTDSASVLADLHRRVQLVIAMDHDEQRFRCHPSSSRSSRLTYGPTSRCRSPFFTSGPAVGSTPMAIATRPSGTRRHPATRTSRRR